jgi:zinc protease
MIGNGLRGAAAFLILAGWPASTFAADTKSADPKPAAIAKAEPVVAPDPAVRFGTTANGFRYAVMQNKSPAGSVSIRLLLKVGSYEEKADELGYAHFIEHMAFRSTKAAPAGMLDNPFAAMGVALGRDQNAFTTVQSTTYGMDVPAANPEGLRKILEWMRSAADGILFTPAAVDVERDVVISELRTRGGPVTDLGREVAHFQAPELLSVNRLPGGTEASLQAATPAKLQAFYERWYRPENAFLVIVGDAPQDQLEALAREAFSSWTARGAPGTKPAPPAALAERGLDAFTKAGDALPPAFSSCRFGPRREIPANPVEAVRRDSYSQIWVSILQTRFAHLSASAGSPLMGGSPMVADQLPDARGTCFIALAANGKWKEALQAEQLEVRRFGRDGPTQQELDEAIEKIRAPLRGAVVQAGARNSAAVAGEIADADLAGRIFSSPDGALAAFGLAVDGVTPADIARRSGATGAAPARCWSRRGRRRLRRPSCSPPGTRMTRRRRPRPMPTGRT